MNFLQRSFCLLVVIPCCLFAQEKEAIPTDLNSYVEETDGNETLADIGKRHSISIEQLKKLNPKIKDGEKLKAGTLVKILLLEKDEKKYPRKLLNYNDLLNDPNIIVMKPTQKIYGVRLAESKEGFKVVQVHKNSPAGKLDIKIGSILFKIDDQSISKLTMKEVIELLKRKESCAMTFKLKDGTTEVVKIKKGAFTVQDGMKQTIYIKPKNLIKPKSDKNKP